jgi:small subunit ribosomal protein S4
MGKRVVEALRSETSKTSAAAGKRPKKLTEYGKQLLEKQKVKYTYGLRERQFKRFFDLATKSQGAPGEILLSLLERRLDNVVYRLKLAATRRQARQIVVHGHVFVNGKKVHSPSYLTNVDDLISLNPGAENKGEFIGQVVDKRLKTKIKVPEWLELDKQTRKGKILRYPVRADIQLPVNENAIVELYSKYA